eukprot:SAG11_NODE_41798_length_189_cov_60.988889_1_plen_24_part_10
MIDYKTMSNERVTVKGYTRRYPGG